MKFTYSIILVVVLVTVFSAVAVSPVFADLPDNALDALKTTGVAEGGVEGDASKFAGQIINAFLSLVGIIFVILIIYGGAIYMTASGDPKKVEKAVGILKGVVIGIVIVVSAYAISTFVIDALIATSTPAPPTP